MAYQAVAGLLAGAINLIRGGVGATRVLRIGGRIFRKLNDGKDHPDILLVPYIDEVRTNASFARAAKKYKLLEQGSKKNILNHMKREAGSIAGAFANLTPPLSNGLAKAKKNIDYDVTRIFRPLEEVPFGELVMARNTSAVMAYNFAFTSKTLTNAAETNNWAIVRDAFERNNWAAKPMMVSVVTKPSKNLHKQARGASGTVKKVFHVAGTRVQAEKEIKRYADDVKKAIGKMAGGWVKCYISLRGTGYMVPMAYASMGHGTVQVQGGENPKVRIHNRYGNFNGHMKRNSSRYAFYVDKHAKRALNLIANDIKKEIQKLGMK
jgi:hypothetical protein